MKILWRFGLFGLKHHRRFCSRSWRKYKKKFQKLGKAFIRPHHSPPDIPVPHFFPPFFFGFFCWPFAPAPPSTPELAALITPSLPVALPPPPPASAPFSPTPPCVSAAALARPFFPFGRYEARSLMGSQRSGSGVLAGS